MATGAVTNDEVENDQCEYDPEAEVLEEEKPAWDTLYFTEHKLKYINNHYEKVNAHMYDYKCDVKLTVGKSNFKGHKKVLADASDYFAAMFSHEMKEKDETVIAMKEISPDGFGAMLDYFYHGHVTVEAKIVPDILEAARFFHVEWILDVCCDYMVRHLSILDYPLTMLLADKFSLGELRWDIFKSFGNNLPSLCEKENFYKECSCELLLQFLMECMYVDVSEFFLMQVILNWVKADVNGGQEQVPNGKQEQLPNGKPSDRQEHLLPLLRQLRFHTMDIEELEAIPKEVLEIAELREEIEDAKMYCFCIPAKCLKTEEKYLIRGSRPCVVASAFNDDAECNTVVYKDPDSEDANLFVEQLGPCGLAADYSTMGQVSIGNFLFAAGGYDEEFTSCARVYMYDPGVREWTEVASMSHPRVSFAFCSSKNRLYAIGGVFHKIGDIDSREVILPAAEMYNPEENGWTSIANLPYGTFDQAAAYSNNTLYVCGGISEKPEHQIPINSMFALEDGANEWTALPDMTIGRQGHSMMALGGKLYILGGFMSKPGESGFVDCCQNDMFDMETKQWTSLTSTPESFGHINRHVGLIYNTIHFLCNNDTEHSLSSFDTEKQEFVQGVIVGDGLVKVSVLQVAYQQS